MFVEVRGSDDRVVLSRVYDSEARLLFTTSRPGDYQICMEPKGSEWWSGALLRVHLDIKMGKQAMGYETSRRTENIDNLQLRVRQLMKW